MKIHQLSLIRLTILCFLFVSSSVYAQSIYCPAKFEVLKRHKKDKYKFVAEEFKDLYCGERFEGDSFKIVHGVSEEPISFLDDPELVRKASNVYYHLNRAKTFWIDTIKSQYVKEMGQITIRLDISNEYSKTRHFKNNKQGESFNNAWTTPAGETPRFISDKKEWGQEIWFNPVKKIESRKNFKSKGKNPVHQSFKVIKDPVVDMNNNSILYTGLALVAQGDFTDYSSFLSFAIQKVGINAIMYGLVETTKHMDKWFVDKYLYVETAMIPDIIYHEFAHVALSDTMKTVHSVPVIEGLADYFATRIDERKKMFHKIKKYSTNRHKSLKNNKHYHPYYEQSWNANTDYVLSLLWLVKERLEKENEKRATKGQDPLVNVDELIFQTHFKLSEYSNIKDHLSRELYNTCTEICTNKRLGHDTIRGALEFKGLR